MWYCIWADGTVAALFEERVGVVVAGIVVAEVIVPVTLFDAVVHVDFPENRDLVASLAEEIGEERNVGGERGAEVLVGESSGGAGVHAGERGGTGGSAECIGAEGVVEEHAFGADAVVIGGSEDRMAFERECVGALALAEEVDEVRPFCLRLRRSGACGYSRRCNCACHGKGSLEKVAPSGFLGFGGV